MSVDFFKFVINPSDEQKSYIKKLKNEVTLHGSPINDFIL